LRLMLYSRDVEDQVKEYQNPFGVRYSTKNATCLMILLIAPFG